jgi:hypothetical protein
VRSLLLATLVGAAVAASTVVTTPPAMAATGVIESMTCVAPGDATGIDAMLARAGSPLQGEGATFVREATAAGLDPRALVAIAAHETILETYGPAQAIHNPFGLGPNIPFPTDADAIARAASTLASGYIGEGRTAIPEIGAKWAPVGASNDPGGLNDNWTAGVGAYYSALGGDPSRPILLTDQEAAPGCSGAASTPAALTTAPTQEAPPAGPPVVVAWGGAAPAVTGASAADGADPSTGAAAVLDGFVFPLALAQGAAASYRDSFSEPGTVDCAGGRHQCALTIQSAAGAATVATVAGTLHAGDAADREEGIAFWIATPGGDRVGYGPLAAYAPGVGEGATVTAGQSLGATAGWVRIAWERAGTRVNPFPLLQATRPPT